MGTQFLRKEWIAVALASAKEEILGENFISVSDNFDLQNKSQVTLLVTNEKNKSEYQLQILKEGEEETLTTFNEEKIDAVVTSGLPDSQGFEIRNGIISVSRSWDIYMLSSDMQSILLDKQLFIDFFIALETEKINMLQNYKGNVKKINYNKNHN